MLIYLIGEPGVGKSTVLAAYWKLTATRNESQATDKIPHTKHFNDETYLGLEIGNPKPKNELHPGTDTLSYGIMPKATEWIQTRTDPLIIAEGDRLAHPKFWEASERSGRKVLLIHVTGPTHTRRVNRGTEQNENWLRSRATRVKNLADNYPHTHLNTIKLTPEEAAQSLNEIINRRKSR